MAKKGNRILIGFVCSVCKHQNYIGSKNKLNVKEKLIFKKFCPKCKKHTEHKETKKLK